MDKITFPVRDPPPPRPDVKKVLLLGRIMGIPSGLNTTSDGFMYAIPDPFSEVFDGMAVGSSINPLTRP